MASVALTGCNGGGDDNGPPTTLPPVTPAASPTEAAGDVPSEATEATPEGAAAFVRAFYEQLEAAYAARDANSLQAYVSPECETCARLLDAIRRLQAESASVEGYSIQVVDVAVPGDAGSERVDAVAVLNVSEFVRVDSAGAETTRQPARENAAQELVLVRSGASWLITELSNA